MTFEEFQTATLKQLRKKTGIDAPRWSRYINSRVCMTERTMLRASRRLEMNPEDFVKALNARRRRVLEGLEKRLSEKTIA